jgi:hypothetical protein
MLLHLLGVCTIQLLIWSTYHELAIIRLQCKPCVVAPTLIAIEDGRGMAVMLNWPCRFQNNNDDFNNAVITPSNQLSKLISIKRTRIQ